MNININSVRFDADVKLKDFISEKINKLTQFYDNIQGAEVFLRIDANDELGNKVTEIKLDIPGSDLFAKKQGKSFEESTDLAIEALRKQVTKLKEKKRGN